MTVDEAMEEARTAAVAKAIVPRVPARLRA
jgi:hypothetical protein